MSALRPYILLLCITGFVVTVEARFLNFITNNDAYSVIEINPAANSNPEKITKEAIVKWLQKIPLNEKQRIEKQENQKILKDHIGKLLKKRKGQKIDSLRYSDTYEIPTVSNFLQTLNNFLIQNTNKNNYGAKRDTCSSGFGTPGSRNKCKREKARQLFTNWKRTEGSLRKYAQHMLEERARYSSDSDSNSDGWEDSDGDDDARDDNNDSEDDNRQAYKGKKSRFEIVTNDKAKKLKGKWKDSTESSEEEYNKRQPSYSSDSDETEKSSVENSSVEQKEKPKPTKYYSDSASEEHTGFAESVEKSDENYSRSSGEKEKYMYLQGTRLQKPYNRSGRRDPRRLDYFLPKRYNWDPDMIHDIADFWNAAIGTHLKTYLQTTYK